MRWVRRQGNRAGGIRKSLPHLKLIPFLELSRDAPLPALVQLHVESRFDLRRRNSFPGNIVFVAVLMCQILAMFVVLRLVRLRDRHKARGGEKRKVQDPRIFYVAVLLATVAIMSLIQLAHTVGACVGIIRGYGEAGFYLNGTWTSEDAV